MNGTMERRIEICRECEITGICIDPRTPLFKAMHTENGLYGMMPSESYPKKVPSWCPYYVEYCIFSWNKTGRR